eukprot:10038771-Alexandrium_andersonii.AAC.1
MDNGPQVTIPQQRPGLLGSSPQDGILQFQNHSFVVDAQANGPIQVKASNDPTDFRASGGDPGATDWRPEGTGSRPPPVEHEVNEGRGNGKRSLRPMR